MKIKNSKKIVMMAVIAGSVFLASTAFKPFQEVQDPERNLEILPKDISEDELMAVMESFQVALGMGCDDCHARAKDGSSKLDFKSDDHPNKEVSRDMMRMTAELNEKYFDVPGDFKDNYLFQEYPVTCVSCHNGHEYPVQRISVPINFDEMEK